MEIKTCKSGGWTLC